MALWGAGFCPLHPPRLNLSGTGYPCRCGTRRGQGGLPPCGTGSPCPGGEDHLKRRRRLRRIVPSPPVPPLLGCRHCLPVPRPNRHAPSGHRNGAQTLLRKGQSPTPGICLAGSVSAARVQPRGCKGRSPLHKKTFVLPLPRRGRGSGGWGQKNYDTYCKSGNRPAASWYARRPSERHLTRPALLFPFPPAQCGRDHPAPCAFPQHPGRKEWWSGHG